MSKVPKAIREVFAYSAVVLSAVGDAYKNIVYNSGSGLNAGFSTSQDIWRPGGSTFPAAYSQTYLGW